MVPEYTAAMRNPGVISTIDRNTRAVAFLRIAVGALFLIFGEYKVFGTAFTLGGGFQYWISRFLQDGAYPFMVPVLRGFVFHGDAAWRPGSCLVSNQVVKAKKVTREWRAIAAEPKSQTLFSS